MKYLLLLFLLVGKMKQFKIAKRFKVIQQVISDIKLGNTWGWLTGR